MSELKLTPKTVYFVDTTDLEAFIKEETGHTYQIIPIWKQTPLVVSDHYVARYQELWRTFKKNDNYSVFIQVILNGLYSEGKLPEGIYIVEEEPTPFSPIPVYPEPDNRWD